MFGEQRKMCKRRIHLHHLAILSFTTELLLMANAKSLFFLSPCSWQAWGGTENMAEPPRESTSSLQRKKPPWLRLDIPTAQMSLDEPSTFVQVSVLPNLLLIYLMSFYLCPDASYASFPVQPVKRQGFLRSISMPVETTHLQSPPRDFFDTRRPVLQRQPSITQTIKR